MPILIQIENNKPIHIETGHVSDLCVFLLRHGYVDEAQCLAKLDEPEGFIWLYEPVSRQAKDCDCDHSVSGWFFKKGA